MNQLFSFGSKSSFTDEAKAELFWWTVSKIASSVRQKGQNDHNVLLSFFFSFSHFLSSPISSSWPQPYTHTPISRTHATTSIARRPSSTSARLGVALLAAQQARSSPAFVALRAVRRVHSSPTSAPLRMAWRLAALLHALACCGAVAPPRGPWWLLLVGVCTPLLLHVSALVSRPLFSTPTCPGIITPPHASWQLLKSFSFEFG